MAKQYLMPYTNLHELNLDWLINAMKQLEARWDGLEMKTTASIETTAGNPEVIVSGSLKDTLNFDFKLPQGSAFPSADTPLMDQKNGVIGVSKQFARGDHVHPSDTSKVDKIVPSTSTTYFYCQDTQNTFLTPTQEYVLQDELTNEIKLIAETKQDTLISGTNIKTINNSDITGSGNLKTLLNLETVWENTNQGAFAAQTIQLDLSKYQAVVITWLCSANTTASGFITTLIPLSVESMVKSVIYDSENNGALIWRTVFPQQSQITFQIGNWVHSSDNTYGASINTLIPITIYGV